MAPGRVTQVNANGTVIACEVSGTGPAVLFVTGAGTRFSLWRDQVRPLIAAGLRVVAYDLRDAGPFGLEDLVDDAEALIDALALAPCRVVGYSLGSAVAQELTIRRPSAVARLVLMAAGGRVGTLRQAVLQGYADYLRGDARLDPRFQAALSALRMFGPATRGDERRIEDWLTLLAFAGEDAGAAGQYEVAASLGDRRDRLPRLTVPTMVVGFEHDVLVPSDDMRQVAALIPGARYEEVAGCGHLGLVERPNEITRLLLDFLAPPSAV
jgi:thioesterase CepJ